MGAWDNLSIREKADMMKAAIRNGITTLPEIKQAYNEFAEGGNIYGNGGQKKSGGSFYQTHRARWFNFLCKKGVNPVKAERLASYFSAQDALESGHGTSSAARQKNNYGGMQRLDKKTNKMVNVSYGSIDDYMNAKWKMMNNRFGRALNAKSIQEYANILNDPKYHGKGYMYGLYEGYRDGQPLDVARQTKYMNNYTKIMMDIAGEKGFKGTAVPAGSQSSEVEAPTSIARPENPYTQFIPFEPFNPQAFGAPQAFVAPTREEFEIEQPLVEAANDYAYSPEQLEKEDRRQGLNNLSFILGMMNGGNGSSFADTIGMLTGNIAAEGGKIHIKPENRGKFTALKERTGHSATWFKEHGTPAQKKMATFALNARHWKHGYGGHIYDGTTEDSQLMNVPYAGELPDITVMPRRIVNKAWDKVQERWVGDMPTYYAVNPETGKEEMLREIGNGKYSTYDDKHVFDVLGAEAAKKQKEQWIKNGGTAGDFDKVMLGTLGVSLAPIALPEIAAGVSSLPVWDAMGAGAETLLAKQGVQEALPWIKSGIASYFAADGLNRFIGPEGAAKTDRMFSTMVNDPNWYNMVNFGKSALGDVLDVSMAGPVVGGATGLKFSTEAAEDLLSTAKDAASKTALSAERAAKRWYNKSNILAKDLFARRSPTYIKYKDTQNRLYEYMRDYGKAELNAAREKKMNAWNLYRKYKYNSNFAGHKTKQDAFVRNGEINWDKLSLEDREKFFRKHGSQDPELFAKTYNPNTGEFEYDADRTFFEGFKPSDAVTTGDIQIKDLQTGKLQSFNIEAPEIGGTERVKYAFDPNSLNSTVREVSAERKSATQALAPTMPEGYADAIQKNMDYVNSTILPGSRPFGSTTNIAKGNLVHGSHDIDVIMTEAQMKKHPEAKKFYEKIGGATYGYNHPQAGEIDINIIREKRGKAYGQRAHELYAQLFPEEYQKLMMSYAEKGKEINTEIPLNISAQKLLDAYDPVTKGIADAFGSGKDKHMKRALYYLHYGDVNDVRNGFDMYANYLLGGKYKPSTIALSEFDNPQVNAQLIDELELSAINKEQFINDPERMKLLFDYAVFDKSFVGRGVSNGNDDIIKSLTYWYPNTNGGTFNGVGLNTVIGGNSGHGDIYATLVPNRLNISTGPTPRDVLNSLVKDRPLSSEEINDVIQLANSHNVPMKDPQTFADILRQTEGKTGENYKEFINDLAKRFDRPFIEGGSYGNAPYASLLEDQSKSAIQQIIPYGMDRPTPSSARDMVARTHVYDEQQGDNFKKAMDIVGRESRQRKLFKYIGKNSPGWEEGGLAKIANKNYKKISDEVSKISAKVQTGLANPDIMHQTALDRIQENYRKYTRLLDRIRKGIKITGIAAGVGGLVVGMPKLLEREDDDVRAERRKKYSQLKRSMKEGEQE